MYMQRSAQAVSEFSFRFSMFQPKALGPGRRHEGHRLAEVPGAAAIEADAGRLRDFPPAFPAFPAWLTMEGEQQIYVLAVKWLDINH